MHGNKNSFFCLVLLMAIFGGACNQGSQPTVNTPPPVAPAKHYQLKGKVLSIDKQGKTVNVNGEAISGYMDAMAMPYQVKPESELDKLHAGDKITADLTVQGDGAWLENISISGHTAAPASK
jgi:protein SCO1